MNTKKLNDFIDSLIRDTLDGCLEWIYIDAMTDEIARLTGAFPVELSGTEISDVDYHRSYACQTNAGAVFLVYVLTYATEDANAWEGFELFLHPSPYELSRYFLLLQGSEELYRMENAIKSKVSASVRSLIRDEDYYLDLYLRARRSMPSADV